MCFYIYALPGPFGGGGDTFSKCGQNDKSLLRQEDLVPFYITYLHPGLDYIKRSVSKHAGCSCYGSKGPCHQWIDGFIGVITW